MTANKFLKLYQGVVANAVIDQNVLDMNRILHDLCREGMVVKREDVATLSPYLTQHIKRFGDYQIDGLNDMMLTEDDDVPPPGQIMQPGEDRVRAGVHPGL